MKILMISLLIFFARESTSAAVRCQGRGELITLDADRRQVEINRKGRIIFLKILSANHHAYGLFGAEAYQTEGGYIFGLKKNRPELSQRDLTIFRNSEPLLSYRDCVDSQRP